MAKIITTSKWLGKSELAQKRPVTCEYPLLPSLGSLSTICVKCATFLHMVIHELHTTTKWLGKSESTQKRPATWHITSNEYLLTFKQRKICLKSYSTLHVKKLYRESAVRSSVFVIDLSFILVPSFYMEFLMALVIYYTAVGTLSLLVFRSLYIFCFLLHGAICLR